jgi:hypothetical protein
MGGRSQSLRGPPSYGTKPRAKLQAIKDVLETGPSGAVQVVRSMEEAIDTLFPFSEIYKAGREFYLFGG